jgi:TrpR-related protein YerC/YecD
MAMGREPADARKERLSLCRAILLLRTPKECENFLKDLCSVSELDAMASRWRMARELRRGRTYQEISRITRSSTTTVTRAAYWMKYGAGGFRMMLNRFGGKPRRAREQPPPP